MIKAFFWSKKWFWWAYGGGLTLILMSYGQVHLSVLFNAWQRNFYNIMQKPAKYTFQEFNAGLERFLMLAAFWIVLGAIMNFAASHYGFRWREAITKDYLPRWKNVPIKIEGESQRMQEDPALFAEIVESLGLQVINAIMTLIAFIPILWALSKEVKYWFLTDISGSLVWVALVVTIGGMAITWFVALKLPKLEYKNQVVEAAFRKELVLAEEDKANHSDLTTLLGLFMGVKLNYCRLYFSKGYVDLWLNMYSQIMIILPYVIMGSSLMAGIATLGVVVQVSSAFGEVRSSMAIFINNWKVITRLRSIRMRLKEFEQNLDKFQTPETTEKKENE